MERAAADVPFRFPCDPSSQLLRVNVEDRAACGAASCRWLHHPRCLRRCARPAGASSAPWVCSPSVRSALHPEEALPAPRRLLTADEVREAQGVHGSAGRRGGWRPRVDSGQAPHRGAGRCPEMPCGSCGSCATNVEPLLRGTLLTPFVQNRLGLPRRLQGRGGVSPGDRSEQSEQRVLRHRKGFR